MILRHFKIEFILSRFMVLGTPLNQVEVQSSFYEESQENNTFFDDSSNDE